MSEYADGPGSFRYLPELLTEVAAERIIDRALLALVVSMKPGFTTPGGVRKEKTRKQREIDNAVLDALLTLMDRDLHIITRAGNTTSALRFGLLDLGVERGLFTMHADQAPAYRPVYVYSGTSLFDVMSAERKDREYPNRGRKPSWVRTTT